MCEKGEKLKSFFLSWLFRQCTVCLRRLLSQTCPHLSSHFCSLFVRLMMMKQHTFHNTPQLRQHSTTLLNYSTNYYTRTIKPYYDTMHFFFSGARNRNQPNSVALHLSCDFMHQQQKNNQKSQERRNFENSFDTASHCSHSVVCAAFYTLTTCSSCVFHTVLSERNKLFNRMIY